MKVTRRPTTTYVLELSRDELRAVRRGLEAFIADTYRGGSTDGATSAALLVEVEAALDPAAPAPSTAPATREGDR